MVGLAALGWYLGRSSAEPETAPPPPASQTAVDPLQAQQIVHLEAMLREAEANLARQRQEIAALERQLEVAKADNERQRQGLEQAVEQLDRLNDELLELQAATRAAQPRLAMPPAGTVGVTPLGAPHVTTNQFGYVVASGLVSNPTDYPERGTLEVSLVGAGGVIDTRSFTMTIGAGRTERYDVTFTNIFPTERLGAQARWVP